MATNLSSTKLTRRSALLGGVALSALAGTAVAAVPVVEDPLVRLYRALITIEAEEHRITVETERVCLWPSGGRGEGDDACGGAASRAVSGHSPAPPAC